MRRVWLSWSSGKDSAWTLRALQRDPDVELAGLLTTFNEAADRVAMHAVRRELARAQADAAGLPLVEVDLPWPCSNEEYEARMRGAVERARADRVEAVAFGDLFLEDVRDYRVRQMQGTGIDCLFPIWGADTSELARQIVDAGVVAHVTCVDPKQMDGALCGRRYDHALLDALPAGVDPCGENGEMHTFVSAGPMFTRSIAVEVGEVVERDGFVFADVLPTQTADGAPAGVGSGDG